MYGLSGLRRRVDALLRKYAKEVAVVRLRPLTQEFSTQWTIAIADRQPPPDTHPFILRVADAGFRLTTFMSVHKYLEKCRSENTLPQSDKMVQALLPWYGSLVPIYTFDESY